MHPLRKHILNKLILNNNSSFSKLKPKNIESNLFIYHLKQLIIGGLVNKNPEGLYELTSQGKHFADQLNLGTFKLPFQPKVINLIICQNSKKEVVLYKRKGQPLLGLIGFPFTEIYLGETISQAAINGFKFITQLTLQKPKHIGEVYITTYQNQDLLSCVLCHIFIANNFKGELVKDSEIGELFWGKIEDTNPKDLIPGALDIHKLINQKSSKLFFREFIYHI